MVHRGSPVWHLAVTLDPELHLSEASMQGGLTIDRGTAFDLLDILVSNVGRRHTLESKVARPR
jgi:hypothetical protein